MNRIKFFEKAGKYTVTRFGQFIILPCLVAVLLAPSFNISPKGVVSGNTTKTMRIK